MSTKKEFEMQSSIPITVELKARLASMLDWLPFVNVKHYN